MKNEIKNLKASLEVVRDYAKEAENLVTQINKETENIRKEYDLTLPQIKDMIHEDMLVLKEFSNPKYPDTTRLTVCVGQENGLHFKAYILLSDEGEYKKASDEDDECNESETSFSPEKALESAISHLKDKISEKTGIDPDKIDVEIRKVDLSSLFKKIMEDHSDLSDDEE